MVQQMLVSVQRIPQDITYDTGMPLTVMLCSNISPVEVEQVLVTHPAVEDAAVIGVRDAELGERVAGFVQLKSTDPENVALKDIRSFLAERLADYKIPEQLKIVSEIPRNALGKIDRNALSSLLSN